MRLKMLTPYTREALARLAMLLLLVPLAALIFGSAASAQEGGTRIRIEAPPEVKPGEVFDADVLVENVEHVASFSLTVTFDSDLVTLQDLKETGQFFTTGQRENIICSDSRETSGPPVGATAVSPTGEATATAPFAGDEFSFFCLTGNPPVCLDGPSGPSGSGLLGRLTFKAEKSGTAELRLSESSMALDDIEPCDPDIAESIAINHARQGATVKIGGDSFPWLTVGVIVGVVAIGLVAGSLGGVIWYRRRAGGGPGPQA